MLTSIKRVACAVSGGVDSAVSAYLLKKQGYDVIGVFMRNWDDLDETGYCSINKEYEDAKWTCQQLCIPFTQVNLVKEYWNEVFKNLLDEYEAGLTPNPDILCNKNIKFGHFFDYCIHKFGVDAIATGHYAQTLLNNFNSCDNNTKVRLLQSVDKVKDQTYFLSQIPQHSLRKWLFPVGGLYKSQVKQLAKDVGLSRIVIKKESMGICFVGKRNFKSFIDGYLSSKEGKFVHYETGEIVGAHNGIHHYTLGQRCKIGGLKTPFFVADKNAETQDILVVPDTDHPALYSSSLHTDEPYWICEEPEELIEDGQFSCLFRFQNTMPLLRSTIQRNDDGLKVDIERPLRALTPGQYAVFYKDEECLGSARIIRRS